MKHQLSTVLLILAVASSAGAVVDPDTNSMGIYFDPDADVYSLYSAPYMVVPAYVMLTSPDFDAVYGYEFGFDIEGNYLLTSVLLNGSGPIDVGGWPGNYIVGLAVPLPTLPALRLATLSVFLLDSEAVLFTLHGAQPNSVPGSNTPAVLLAGDVILPTGVSVWDPVLGQPGVCAGINATHGDPWGVIAVDQASWDEVKSLYR